MAELILLLQLYWPSILVASLAAVVLSQLGSHMAGRDQSLKVVCMAQGATTGVLLSLVALLLFAGEHMLEEAVLQSSILPMLGGFAISVAIGGFLEHIANRSVASRNTYFIAVFTVLMAGNALISRAFPNLDQHFSRVFFGDITTASKEDLYILMSASLLTLLLYGLSWQSYVRETFEYAFFGFIQEHRATWQRIGFDLWSLAYLCLAIQSLGFIGTMALLFLPTLILKTWPNHRISSHLLAVGIFALLTIPVGFVFSLMLPQLPTVSVLVLTMVLIGFGLATVSRIRNP